MNDRYFDEVIRVKLEAMQDVNAVDETALEEVLDLADQLSPSQSWWSQLSSSSNWNIWWFGAISGIVIVGICWWTLVGDLPVELESPVETEEVLLSLPEKDTPEILDVNQETVPSHSLASVPIPSSQDSKEELVEGLDSLPLIQEDIYIQRTPLPRINRIEKIPILSIADISVSIPEPVPIRLLQLPQPKTSSEPPTYHSPSHPNKKRTSKTRPPKNISDRREDL